MNSISKKLAFDNVRAGAIDWMKLDNINCAASTIKMLEQVNYLSNDQKYEINKLKQLFDITFEGDTYEEYSKTIEASIPENYVLEDEQWLYVVYNFLLNLYEATEYSLFYEYFSDLSIEWEDLNNLVSTYIKNQESKDVFCAWLLGHSALAMGILNKLVISYAGLTAAYIDEDAEKLINKEE